MKSLDENYYNPFFSHIYVEEEIAEHPRVKQILARFMKAEIVYIRHYKDVLCRRRQDYEEQHHAQNLILAKKTGSLIYQGAPVCQNFGNTYFYYTSCMMNCIYDCEYCYLKGMYPSANIVIFVNIEDIFEELHRMLSEHPVYLCVSYDTDLLAFEAMTGYVREWEHFVLEENKRSTYPLKIEIRTKSANVKLFDNLIPDKNIIYAFTLSPQQITKQYEHNTPSLLQRVRCVADAVKKGFPVRLCFDPMIYCPDWEKEYHEMLELVTKEVPMDQIFDVSVGSFRVSQDYLKKMRKNEPYSAVVQFPFQNDGGVYHYGKELTEQMERFLIRQLLEYVPEEKIFRWES